MADVTGASGASDNLFVLRFNGATNKLFFGVDATAAQIASANGHTLSFRAGAYSTTSPHLLISNATGFVGVGTTTPGSLLSVGDTNGINFSTATSSFSSTGGRVRSWAANGHSLNGDRSHQFPTSV